MSTYKKLKLAKTPNGIVPYISYYTDLNVNNSDLTINTEDEDFDFETDYDYEPGIIVPAYGDRYRHELPQIDFPLFFNKMGPDKFSRRKIKLSELTPSQCEFSEKKVIDIIREADDIGPILISKDCKIIDGHHRWLAAVNMGHSDIEANQVDMTFDDVMEALDASPEVAETKTVYESYFVEAEYKGRKVTLNKPFRTPNGPKKSRRNFTH